MRFVPTPTASPQWRRDGCLVTAVARDNAAVPRSPLHRPYVSLNLRVAGQRTNALVGISFHRNQQQNRLADMLLLIGQKIGKMLPILRRASGYFRFIGSVSITTIGTKSSSHDSVSGRGSLGDAVVNPPDEFRKHAAECMRMAAATRDAKEKAAWTGLAQRWTTCASVSEASYGVARQSKGAAAGQRGSSARL